MNTLEWPKLKNIIILILLLVNGFLLVLGIDDLKSINLKQGRRAGDAILKRVAESWRT